MEIFKLVIFYLLLLDSIIANIVAWTAQEWYINRFRTVSRIFPLAKGWTVLYIALVLWIGHLTGVF